MLMVILMLMLLLMLMLMCDGIDVIHSATTAVRVGKVHEMAWSSPFCKD